MSRTGECGLRRSASGRDGSPSKSITNHSRPARSTWPRCRSPWMRCAGGPESQVLSAPKAVRRPGTNGRSAGTQCAAASSRSVMPAAVRAFSCRVSQGNAEASARWTSAVARPNWCASAVKSAPEASAWSASAQPSVASRRKGWSTPSVASHGLVVRNQATGSGTRGQPCRASAPGTSRSGLTPGWMRRNTFSTKASPYTSEELDCSASISRGVRPGGTGTDEQDSKRSGPAVPGWRSRSRSICAERRSCSASYTVSPASGPSSARPMRLRPSRGDGCWRTPSSSW